MKRVGYLYEKLCDKALIEKAIREASKGKTKRAYVRKVLANTDYYVDQLYEMFVSRNVKLTIPRERTIFDNSSLKERHIKIPRFFPDQIIHWCVILITYPIMQKGMYQYCCGSVPKKGGIVGKRYLEKCLRRDKSLKYCLKLDIHKFFPSCNKNCMMGMFERKIKDREFLALIEQILDNGDEGLPIGFYTSQWFSNFYLERLDHFIKEKERTKVYIRYVDDMTLLDTNKRKLHKTLIKIRDFLATIRLRLKENYQVWKLDSRPIDFLGYRFFRGFTQLRKRIYYRICRRLSRIKDYITVSQARGILSLLGWLQQIDNNLYRKTKELKSMLAIIVSNYDRRKLNYGNI